MQIVPQYIDIEDKIAGPLTWKHIGWLFGGGSILVIAFLLLDTITFFIVAIPISLLFLALAFYRPHGVSFIEFFGYGFMFLFRPRKYVWSRDVQIQQRKSKKIQQQTQILKNKKELSIQDIEAIAKTLDSNGKERNKRVQELIKKSQIKK